jgi:hypothetical protein
MDPWAETEDATVDDVTGEIANLAWWRDVMLAGHAEAGREPGGKLRFRLTPDGLAAIALVTAEDAHRRAAVPAAAVTGEMMTAALAALRAYAAEDDGLGETAAVNGAVAALKSIVGAAAPDDPATALSPIEQAAAAELFAPVVLGTHREAT